MVLLEAQFRTKLVANLSQRGPMILSEIPENSIGKQQLPASEWAIRQPFVNDIGRLMGRTEKPHEARKRKPIPSIIFDGCSQRRFGVRRPCPTDIDLALDAKG